MVGTGIGAAIYVNGQVLRGANGWAGELGRIPINGEKLDRQASGAAILQQLEIYSEGLVTLVATKDPAALQAIRRSGHALGMGLATMINLFNPAEIVLAGGTLRWHGYLDAAVQSAEQHSLPDLWAACRLQTSPHGDDLVVLGAMQTA